MSKDEVVRSSKDVSQSGFVTRKQSVEKDPAVAENAPIKRKRPQNFEIETIKFSTHCENQDEVEHLN